MDVDMKINPNGVEWRDSKVTDMSLYAVHTQWVDGIKAELYEACSPDGVCRIIAQQRLLGNWGDQYPGYLPVYPNHATDTVAALLVSRHHVATLKEAYELIMSLPYTILVPWFRTRDEEVKDDQPEEPVEMEIATGVFPGFLTAEELLRDDE